MKMCPFCGRKVKDDYPKCPNCRRKLSIPEKQMNFSFVKTFFKITFLCIAVFSVIVFPACFIMLNQYPLMKSKPNICRKECGWFSYDYADSERFCVCKNNDVYSANTYKFIYNKEEALNILLNYNNLDLFYNQFESRKDILLVVKNKDLKNVTKLENALIRLALEYRNDLFCETDFYYIDLDILKYDEFSRLNQVIDEDLGSENVFAIGIKNGVVVYKKGKSSRFKYDDLSDIIYDYVRG